VNGRAADAVAASALVVAKAAAMAWVLHCGFVQVSDDDHSRVVIAELFAHRPALDPSGTSWLPFPFWIHGAAMAVFGRSLATARAVAFVLGAASALIPWLAARHVGASRAAALLGAALFALTPWTVWLGVAPVPEAWVGALLGGGLLLVNAPGARAAVVGAALLCAAALSRYDGWAACALAAIVLGVRGLRAAGPRRAALLAAAVLAALGPLAWMAWNRHAHGSATHFVDRVAAYRRSIGAASAPLPDKLLGYPRALWSAAPELVVLFAAFAPFAARTAEVRRRWLVPLAGALLSFAFLIYGDVRDGAPTHHPERALVAVLAPLAGFAAEGTVVAGALAMARARRALVVAFAGTAFAAWCYFAAGRWSYVPGRDPSERRDPQIARGDELRARGVAHVTVEPCQYEHFALIAAYGAPENVRTLPSSKRPVTAECPRVTEE
jgi:hypothetical protein